MFQVMESHQAFKLDTSGTAKEVISCFQKLGVSFDLDEVSLWISIVMVCIELINNLYLSEELPNHFGSSC